MRLKFLLAAVLFLTLCLPLAGNAQVGSVQDGGLIGMPAREAMKVIEKTPLKNCYWFAGVFEDMPRDEIIGLCCNDSGWKICSAYPRKALILDWGRADLTTAEMLQIAATSPVKDVRIQWK